MTIEVPAQFFVSITVIAVVLHVILIATAYLILLERKVAAWAQDRVGPNRVGLGFGLDDLWEKIGIGKFMKGRHLGLGHALVDGVKLILKEDYTPPRVDKRLFLLAPIIVVIPALLGWAVVPWGGDHAFTGDVIRPLFGWDAFKIVIPAADISWAVLPVNIGVVYILAIGSLGVYGVVIGAYASNNKYSFLGGLRATAQMLSYEIPMGICVLIAILTFITTDAGTMVNLQAASVEGWNPWGILIHPLLAVIFFVCILAETNRAPFDLAEAEQELVGGFHTEYSSMRWALYFLGEYIHMITGCAFFCILFLGGWSLNPLGLGPDLPIVGEGFWAGFAIALLKFSVFAAKITFMLVVMMWVRWTLPRLRFDQLMKLAWRGLIPLMIVMMLVTGTIVFIDTVTDMAPAVRTLLLLAANLIVAVVAALVAPHLPEGPPVNRRVPLAGSRFSPAS